MSVEVSRWFPTGAATLIGSLPHQDRQQAIDLVLKEVCEVPVWPQLVTYTMEQMMVQFNEGLPGLASRNGSDRFVTSDSRFEHELLEFYEEYLAVTEGELSLTDSRFRFGEECGRTFKAFLELVGSLDPAPVAIKGQVTGPFTLLSGLKQENDRLALYDPRLRDAVVKTLSLKAQWQAELLGQFSAQTIIFVDEPALAGFGSSAFISVSGEEVGAMLEEVVSHIHKAGALAGVHVCANTDWSLFFNSSLDLINFDAYAYFERFALYRQDLVRFFDRGGLVAWGIVPTLDVEKLVEENVGSLTNQWQQQVRELTGKDLSLDTVFSQSLITPSCGCGTLTEPLAEKAIHLTRQVSERLRSEIGD